MNIPIEIKSPFAQIAEIYCPNVYQQLINENLSNQSSNLLFMNTNIFFICLFISFLCIFILSLFGRFLSYIRVIEMLLFAIRRQKFVK
jgi:hypothetical protein